ncbi:MAG: response regulator [Cyanobacteria bacterium J06558_2]
MNTPQKNINRIKILLVDDNPDNLRVLSDILLEYGYQTRKVISGEMALKAVKANDFDLIFLDINMPQLDGYEVCHYLKQDPETAHIPIIFISALSDGKDKSKAFAAGGADYIDKPFQFEEVIARVEHQIKILNLQRELKDLNTSLEDKISASTKELELANQKFKQTQKRLFQLTLKDSVTNLDNKVSFKGHLEQVIKQVKNKPNYGFTLLVFNCRCPYLSNKLFDLNLEDSLAIAIAEILTTSLPKESIIARLGDCEYAVIIKQLQDSSTANKLAAEIKQKLMLPINIKHQQLELIANYGVAVGTQKNPKLDSLFQETIILARQGNHQNSEDLENNLTEKPTESNEKSNILKLEQKIREA